MRKRRIVLWIAFALLLLIAAGLTGGSWYFRRQLEQAKVALAQREYQQAETLLEHYLRYRPSNPEARLLAASVARRFGKYDEAEAHLRQCRRDGGPHDEIDLQFDLIDVKRGSSARVRDLRRRAEQDATHGAEILEVLTQFYLDNYLLQDARRCLDRYLELRPDDLQALMTRAFVWERLQMYPDALQDYRRAVSAHPENDRARLKLAQTLLISGTPTEAMEQFTRLEEHVPNDRDVQLGLAKCERRLAQAERAAKRLDRLIQPHPDPGEARWRKPSNLDSGEARNPKPPTLEPGEAKFGRVPQRSASRPKPPTLEPGVARGRKPPTLEPRVARGRKPPTLDDGEILRERGQVALDLGDAAAAEVWLRRAGEKLPHDRETWHALAGCLRRLGRRDEADQAQARADRIQSDLDRMQKISEAVIRNPNDPGLRHEGAMLFLRNGETAEAIRWLQITLQLDPNFPGARESLLKLQGLN